MHRLIFHQSRAEFARLIPRASKYMGMLRAIWTYKKVWLVPVIIIVLLFSAAALVSGENITLFNYRIF
jgi:hypothetical protein